MFPTLSIAPAQTSLHQSLPHHTAGLNDQGWSFASSLCPGALPRAATLLESVQLFLLELSCSRQLDMGSAAQDGAWQSLCLQDGYSDTPMGMSKPLLHYTHWLISLIEVQATGE